MTGSGTGHRGGADRMMMKIMQGRRPWLLGGVAGLVAVLLVAAWFLLPYTDLAYPQDRYSTTAEPCELLAAATVRELVGQVPGQRTALTGTSGWRPSVYQETTLRCRWQAAPGQDRATLEVEVERLVGTRLGLGRSGAEKAEQRMEQTRPSRCEYRRSDDSGQVCGRSDAGPGAGLRLYVLEENVLVRTRLNLGFRETLPWGPDEQAALLESIAEDVRSGLGRG